MLYQSESGDLTLTLGGDTMLTRRLSVYDEPRFTKLAKLFRDADVGFVKLEGSARHWDEGVPGITRGTYMTTPPELLDDLRWFGVNCRGGTAKFWPCSRDFDERPCFGRRHRCGSLGRRFYFDRQAF